MAAGRGTDRRVLVIGHVQDADATTKAFRSSDTMN